MLGWDVANALPGLRVEAESRMTETVQIGIWADGTDEATGKATRVIVDERYSGMARVRYPSYAAAALSPSTQPISSQDVVISIPVGAAEVFEGDEILVTGSTSDGAVVGRWYTVKGRPLAGQTTAYRITVTEQT